MDDGAEALRLVRGNLFRLYRDALWAVFRRRLFGCCWCFAVVMRALFKCLLAPLVVMEYTVISTVWMVRCLITLADTILARVG